MTPTTRKALERVATLNPAAGEIGAGMLATIVDMAHEALAEEAGRRRRIHRACGLLNEATNPYEARTEQEHARNARNARRLRGFLSARARQGREYRETEGGTYQALI